MPSYKGLTYPTSDMLKLTSKKSKQQGRRKLNRVGSDNLININYGRRNQIG